MRQFMALVVGFLVIWPSAARDVVAPPAKAGDAAKDVRPARDRRLEWLTKNQAKDGSCRH